MKKCLFWLDWKTYWSTLRNGNVGLCWLFHLCCWSVRHHVNQRWCSPHKHKTQQTDTWTFFHRGNVVCILREIICWIVPLRPCLRSLPERDRNRTMSASRWSTLQQHIWMLSIFWIYAKIFGVKPSYRTRINPYRWVVEIKEEFFSWKARAKINFKLIRECAEKKMWPKSLFVDLYLMYGHSHQKYRNKRCWRTFLAIDIMEHCSPGFGLTNSCALGCLFAVDWNEQKWRFG